MCLATSTLISLMLHARAAKLIAGHNDEIISMAQHPKNPDIIATGQVATVVNRRATAPHICVFNSVVRCHLRLKRFCSSPALFPRPSSRHLY